jgi:hypothetical protein
MKKNVHKKSKSMKLSIFRIKSDIDKNNIIELREDIDQMRVQLQKSNLQIEDLLRENTNLKKMVDARFTEAQNIHYQIK